MGPTPPRRSAAAAAAAAAAIARASGAASPPAAPAASAVSSATASSTTRGDHVVRLLTFNVWFEPLAMAARMRAIGAHIERLRPAVVGFQEVTRESLALLRAQRWAKYYDCSADTVPPFSEAYFVVLFSALPVRALETLPFANTGMGRELLVMRVEVARGRELLVGTSHLESLPQFARARVAQLKESLTFLRDRVASDTASLGAVLMGDTNLLRGDMKLLDPRAVAEELTIEAAKTGRAKCRQCGELIAQGSVRVGKTAKDRLPNGRTVEITLWYHRACFLADTAMRETEKQAVREAHAEPQRDGDDGTEHESQSSSAEHAATRGLPSNWRDLWLAVPGNTDENGFTYDGARNKMIRNKAHRSRLDRVYFYAPTHQTRRAFEKIELVGTEPIADGVWASDHFGLLTTLSFDAAIEERDSDADAKRKRDTSPPTNDAPKRRTGGSRDAPIELE